MDLTTIRGKYTTKNFDIKDLNKNPFKQFEVWFNDALNENLLEPNAFSLATVGSDMMPSIRTVLLKYFDNEGFVFFTNYESKKAKQIEQNPKAAALFTWLALERQIKIETNISKTESIAEAKTATEPLIIPKASLIKVKIAATLEDIIVAFF